MSAVGLNDMSVEKTAANLNPIYKVPVETKCFFSQRLCAIFRLQKGSLYGSTCPSSLGRPIHDIVTFSEAAGFSFPGNWLMSCNNSEKTAIPSCQTTKKTIQPFFQKK